jgi:branched-chain amino acid transport system permease protein
MRWHGPDLAERGIGVAVLILIALGPLFLTDNWVKNILTQTFLVGISAASLIFLSAYGGMISLAQTALSGIAGFTLANVVTKNAQQGLNLGWSPWLGVVMAVAVATAVGLVFGMVASRSFGIYFLMITLAYGVIGFYFFLQIDRLSGRAGISTVDLHTPGIVGPPTADPARLYYVALVVAVAVYALVRYVVKTPFGIVLQGIRDEPIRMASLGYNVSLHRVVAFGFAGFIASLSGVLYAWWQGNVDPASIDLTSIVALLIVAVIGGLGRVEGAWVGAFVYIVINNYVRGFGFLDTHFFTRLGLDSAHFSTYIGVIFLAIVVVSPDGLMGIWGRVLGLLDRKGRSAAVEVQPAGPGGGAMRN